MDFHSIFLFLSESDDNEVRSSIYSELAKNKELVEFKQDKHTEKPLLYIRGNDMFFIYKEKDLFDFTFFVYIYEEILTSLCILFKDKVEIDVYVNEWEGFLSEDILHSCIEKALLKHDSNSFHFFAEMLDKLKQEKN